jgi:hypothetical protein
MLMPPYTTDPNTPDILDFELEAIKQLDKDTKAAAKQLDREGARLLVDLYYRSQKGRIALGNQVNALRTAGKPSAVVDHFYSQSLATEKQMVQILGTWAKDYPPGQWLLGQKGMGPILSAALCAYIDITRSQTAAGIWRYAGLDPTSVWMNSRDLYKVCVEKLGIDPKATLTVETLDAVANYIVRKPHNLLRQAAPEELWVKTQDPNTILHNIDFGDLMRAGALRPFNADLKVICWRIGDSFVKVHNKPDAYYGVVYKRRKVWESERNERRVYAETAKQTLEVRNIRDPKTRATYEDGRLPDGRIELRARRYAVKLLLSHFHEILWRHHYKTEPPLPYPIAYLHHVDYLEPPMPVAS